MICHVIAQAEKEPNADRLERPSIAHLWDGFPHGNIGIE